MPWLKTENGWILMNNPGEFSPLKKYKLFSWLLSFLRKIREVVKDNKEAYDEFTKMEAIKNVGQQMIDSKIPRLCRKVKDVELLLVGEKVGGSFYMHPSIGEREVLSVEKELSLLQKFIKIRYYSHKLEAIKNPTYEDSEQANKLEEELWEIEDYAREISSL